MSTQTADRPTTPDAASSGVAPPPPTFVGVVRAEWIKLVSLRSTWWALAGTVAVIALVALGNTVSLGGTAGEAAPPTSGLRGADLIASGFPFGMLTIAVLGVLLFTGEFATGTIRSTFAAVPTRLPVLAAKALVLLVVTVGVTLVSAAVAYVVTMPPLSRHHLVPALDEVGTWRVLGGTVYALAAAALFSLGLGALLRSTAAGIAAALTILMLLPGILTFVTLDWVQDLVRYLPLPASSALLSSGPPLVPGDDLSTQQSLIVLAGYALVPLVAAAVALDRRDA